MIVPLQGWTWEVEDGGVTLRHKEAGERAVITYRERLAPLRSARAIAERRARRIEPTAIGPARPLITREGEHAALVTIDGARRGFRARLELGLVFADDFYARVEGLALGERCFGLVAEAVAELAAADRLLLQVRRRRFGYDPPEGWHGHSPLPLHTHWFPPGYPRVGRMLVVYPALPRNTGGKTSPAQELAVLRTGPTTPLVVESAAGDPAPIAAGDLGGHAWDFACRDRGGRPWSRRVTLLRDERYVYPVFYDRADDSEGPGLEALEELLASIEPVPRPGGDGEAPSAGAGVLDYWV